MELIKNDEFYYFCMEEFRKKHLLVYPEGIWTYGFITHLNNFIKTKLTESYNQSLEPTSKGSGGSV